MFEHRLSSRHALVVAPPGWPAAVRPPGAPGWEHTAANWLLDICPPEYRAYPALRRHAVVLARFAVLHVEARQAAVQRGLSEARGVLRDVAYATRSRPRSTPGTRVRAADRRAPRGRAGRGGAARSAVRRAALTPTQAAGSLAAMAPHHFAGVILVDHRGWVLLQERDEHP